MSLESWRKEYYPVDADKLTSRDDAVLIEASLLKWIGLQKGNLVEHGLQREYSSYKQFLLKGKSMDNHNQCALCTKYYGSNGVFNCFGCPLGNCNFQSAYGEVWADNYKDLTPLIEALANALDKELNHE